MSLLFIIFILVAVGGVPASLLMLLGALNMQRMSNHRLALVGAIVALLPVHLAFPLSIPFGVWALVVLGRPEVRRGFRDGADRPNHEPPKKP